MEKNDQKNNLQFFIALFDRFIYVLNKSNKKSFMVEKNPFRLCPDPQSIINKKPYKTIYAHSILGILTINKLDYLLFTEEVILIGNFNKNDIYKISKAGSIPLFEDSIYQLDTENEVERIKSLLTTGFYYSLNFDLDHSFQQRRSKKMMNNNFSWNANLYKEFYEFGIDGSFKVVLICGHVGIVNYPLEHSNGSYLSSLIITRRNSINLNILTDNLCGVDENGIPQNFYETEVVLLYNNFLCSYVINQSMIPINFNLVNNEIKLKPTLEIKKYFDIFIESIKNKYKYTQFINLEEKKAMKGEELLTNSLESLINQNETLNNFLKYIFITYSENDDELESILWNKLQKIFKIFGFFVLRIGTGFDSKTVLEQSGEIYVFNLKNNSLANKIIMKICMKIIEFFIFNLHNHVNIGIILKNDIINQKNINLNHQFMKSIKDFFDQREKSIDSNLYLKVTDKAFNLKNLVLDFTQKHKNIQTKIDNFSNLLIHFGTWNIAGKDFKDSYQIKDWLQPPELQKKTPDLYILGFQEIVGLNTANVVLNLNNGSVEFLEIFIAKNLSLIDNYYLIKSENLVGILILVFVKESIKKRVKNISSCTSKKGVLGLGNKGNANVKFTYNDFSFDISCCHLSSGLTKNSLRSQELHEVVFKGNSHHDKKEEILENHFQFIFGDLNFRIELEDIVVRKLIDEKKYDSLSAYDQYNMIKSQYPYFTKLIEGELTFPPTYKFDIGTHTYDTSKKKRIPSYCDRILWIENKNIKQIAYNSVDYTYSDHKPVYGIFHVSTFNRKEIMNELKDSLRNKVGGLQKIPILSKTASSAFFQKDLLNMNEPNEFSKIVNINSKSKQRGIQENDNVKK